MMEHLSVLLDYFVSAKRGSTKCSYVCSEWFETKSNRFIIPLVLGLIFIWNVPDLIHFLNCMKLSFSQT